MEKNRRGHYIFNFFSKSVTTVIVLFIVSVFVGAFVYVYAILHVFAPKKILKSLQEEYRGEKFEIIESYGNEKDNEIGVYIVSPINNKEIQFKMYNTVKFRNDDDYSAQRLKYYFENCEDKNITEDFIIHQDTMMYRDVDFLTYSIGLNLDNYNEIENKVTKMFKLKQYFISKDSKMFEIISLDNDNMNYHFWIHCDSENTLEQEIYRAKYEYIYALKNTNMSNQLSEISQREIDQIWKPKELILVINDSESAKVIYEPDSKQYYLDYPNIVLKNIDKIEIVSSTRDYVKKIRYNNKTYKIIQEKANKLKSNEISLSNDIEQIFSTFDASIDYDYDNGKVYIYF